MSTILITGCSTGIGFATAEVLARSGHTVYATMRNPQGSPELEKLAEQDNLPIIVLPMDVNSDESVKATITQVLAQAGQIDVLVNNAGIFRLGAVEELPLSAFQEVMETNYFGTIRCIQAALPSMREKGAGCIVNVTSIASKIYGGFQGTYAASKAAAEAFSESLAAEVQPFGIRVVLVEPGVIDTPILDKMERPSPTTKYPIVNRAKAFYAASQANHVSPGLVGETIRDILAGNDTQMRYPVGPDAALLLGWRASLSDYEWISSGNVDEETWIAGMDQLGLNVRPYLGAGK
ncbi:SDR family oxidoreductase [Spirosoma fluviale]|uniref:Short-chain dehydrogenase n=1 Tax=Spirosoma fluviale TaxID=1597977 RepID=A0A286GPL0_9BACT|nr:SDR family oxidoreductase [Spirosoma fluviale]SOD97458.1 Short-chain dehydrogenase [Spirosoma fluviale]